MAAAGTTAALGAAAGMAAAVLAAVGFAAAELAAGGLAGIFADADGHPPGACCSVTVTVTGAWVFTWAASSDITCDPRTERTMDSADARPDGAFAGIEEAGAA